MPDNILSNSQFNWTDFISNLFIEPSTKEDIVAKFNSLDSSQVNVFWEQLLKFLHSNNGLLKIMQNDFQSESFFDYVQGQNDKDYDIDNLDHYWNESIQQMIDYYKNNFSQIEEETNNGQYESTINNGKVHTDYYVSNSERTMNSEDIKHADAGLNFNDQSSDSSNLWVRLLMPQNSRRTSLEDLNRNFWVISQAITAIGAQVLGSQAPIPYIVKNVLKELSELWDNVLYLWAAFAMIQQRDAKGLKTIIVPLNPTPYQTFEKYDDFVVSNLPTNYDSTTENIGQGRFILDRVMPIIERYNTQHLCIIVYTKNNNYYRNYFSSQTFRGMILHNAITKVNSWFPFVYPINGTNASIFFSPAAYKDKIYGVRETETYYNWCYPVENVVNLYDASTTGARYYGALRIVPDIDITMNSNHEIELKKLSLIAYDVGAKILHGQDVEICRYELIEPVSEGEIKTIDDVPTRIYAKFNYIENESFVPPYPSGTDIYECGVKKAYYLGEIPSCCFSASYKPNLIYQSTNTLIGDGQLIKIGNYIPRNYENYYENSNYYSLQKNPNGGTTDYLMNLTPNCKTNPVLNAVYKGAGSNINHPSDECLLFKPVATRENNTITYSFEKGNTSSAYTINDYRTLGYDVIENYITASGSSRPSRITYFIAAIGIQPWHNSLSNNISQGYWKTNILTHIFRYVPPALSDYVESLDGDREKTFSYGRLQCLGLVNCNETKFGNNIFVVKNTTWRLPQLNAEQTLLERWCYQNANDSQIYFVDSSSLPNNAETPSDRANPQAWIPYLNDHLDELIAMPDSPISDKEKIKTTLSEPEGVWCVFDGNSTSYSGNHHQYVKNKQLREVAHLSFTYSGEVFGKDDGWWRGINNSSWSSTVPSNILPAATVQDGHYSW